MAHTKAQGKTRQKTTRPGKRLGVKVFGGQKIGPGEIIIRQRGTKFHPGENVSLGKDFTIFSLKKGTVIFKQRNGKKFVSVA